MKKKLIITCSLITILLAGFPHVLYAEDVPQSFEGGYTTHYGNISELDDYFYDNFILLPYLESDGTQYINSDIIAKSTYTTDVYISNFKTDDVYQYIFGQFENDSSTRYAFNYLYNQSRLAVFYSISYVNYDQELIYDNLYHFKIDENELYMNDSLIHTFTNSSFNSSNKIYIFGLNNQGTASNFGKFRLYYMSIYDNDLDGNNEEIGLLRSFYPAKQKSNGSYGLYDAVNKIFYVSNSANPFVNPEGSDVELSLLSRIGLWLRTSLGSISEIFTYIVTEPIILFFMAIGLAGAMYRWARRLVHF